jgi:hypothetical protein
MVSLARYEALLRHFRQIIHQFYTFLGYHRAFPKHDAMLEPMLVSEPGLSPELVKLIELAAHPDALRWAHECGWVPGTGHCRNRACASECLFREQRDAEARQVIRARRRRKAQQPCTVERNSSSPGCDRIAGCTG